MRSGITLFSEVSAKNGKGILQSITSFLSGTVQSIIFF